MSFNYNTISTPGTGLYKVKGSKHFGYAYNARSEEEIAGLLEKVKAEHHSARHVAYAWRLGIEKEHYRANDDGEPANSAGKPILGQIEKYDLTNVLIAVVRYFGGTKLGVGGLIDAYRTAAQMAIDDATVVEKQLLAHFKIHFEYDRMSEVMLAIRVNAWENFDPDFRQSCSIKIAILPEKKDEIELAFQAFSDIRREYLGIY
ncbi:YigZ family protein [Cryomorpha ignava]|uniref:YigZ family protein n=1 Tax=Cryomorpha ignava TaxID=101383 RepID=A0A7K3WU10_9FLAO|nr:YigZ family protein [Cryomorpha ignava]NEN24966.1 YigZ family protein [Cryomorpha ignava]